MASVQNGVTIADGSMDWSGGVNSIKVPTIQSPQNPHGLSRDELAWLINGTIRDGGISPRAGYTMLGNVHDGSALFQGSFMYDPPSDLTAFSAGNGQFLYDATGHKTDVRGSAVANATANFTVPLSVGASSNLAINGIYLGAINDLVTLYLGTTPYGVYKVTANPPGVVTLEAVYIAGIWGLVLAGPKTLFGPPIVPVVQPIVTIDPYLMVLIGGILYQVIPEPFTVINLSALFGLTMPATVETAFFCQAEEFLIIQIHDGVTLPLFWDGQTLRRSRGITNTGVAPGTPGVNEIPSAGAMDYYMGRLWYCRGRQYGAGDIVNGPSGTNQYNFRDSLLNVTENPLVLGGDGFTVPENSGTIRAIKHNGQLDTALGQGIMFIFTATAVYALKVPVTRNDWIAATNSNQPLQTVVQLVNGAVNDRGIVAANGDLFYMSLEPGIRSLISAIRYFQQWGNVQISANEERLLQFCDRGLLHAASGIVFDNRLLMTSLHKQTPQGIVGQVVIPMDFTPINSFGSDTHPVWEGMRDGIDILQLLAGNFGGRERAFALNVSRSVGTIDLWELTKASRFDLHPATEVAAEVLSGQLVDKRVTMIIEFPAFTWGEEFLLKKMVSGELWVDRVFGEVVFKMEWRPDGDTCWHFWHEWKICTTRNCAEDVYQPCTYPIIPNGTSYRQTMTLPIPPAICAFVMGRPGNVGYQMQPRLTVTGYCRVRGLLLHSERVDRKLYANMTP